VKLAPNSNKVLGRLRALVSSVFRFLRRLLWPGKTWALATPPTRFRTFLLALVIISVVSATGAYLMRLTGTAETQQAWSTSGIDSLTQNRLHAIAISLDSTRDWLATDPLIRNAALIHDTPKLFSLLYQKDAAYSLRFPDSVLYTKGSDGKKAIHRGYAIYSADGRLEAWNSPVAATFGFDTVLPASLMLPTRDRGIMLENGPIYAYLVAVRKVVSRDGRVELYVESKQQLATKEPLTGNPSTAFIDDIISRAGRDLILSFDGEGRISHSSSDSVVRLMADPSDPASFVGTLSISKTPQTEPSLPYRLLHGLWTLSFSLAIFAALLWLLIAISEVPPDRRPLRAKVIYSVATIAALFIVRVIIVNLGAASKFFGAAYQDPADFASDWLLGIAKNPLELFITTVFATAAAVMLWIIWLPRERLVRDESKERDIRPVSSGKKIASFLYAIAAVIATQLLVDALSGTVEAIVSNGGIRYLTVRQVLPLPGMLMMLLSLLGIGVTYLFTAVLTLTFAIRAIANASSHRGSIVGRITVSSLALAILCTAVVFFLDQAALTDTSLLYRGVLAAVTFLASIAIIAIDSTASDREEKSPSFLYKLPRSSRSILFILAFSAVIISPLVAAKQLLIDKEIARRVAAENAEVDVPELQNTTEHLLLTAEDRLRQWASAGHDTITLRDEAFLIWLTGMREHPGWNVSVDVYNAAGIRQSHFATFGAIGELDRLHPQLDSELTHIRRFDSTHFDAHVLQGFTSSGAPAILGGLHYRDSGQTAKPVNQPSHLYVVASVWSELPALTVARSQIAIAPMRTGTTNDPVTNGNFIVAQYRPNMRRLTNSPSMDVPAAVPSTIERLLAKHRSIWLETTINGAHYQTLFYRANTSLSKGERPTIITVSIPEPTYTRTLEFALRLNGIGLIYGTLIVLILLIVRQVATRRLKFTLHFRDRIFLIVLVIALVPLVVVTNVTRNLLAERAQVEQQDRLSRDASVIRERITRKMEVANWTKADLQSEVDYLSRVIGRDFSVYDAQGRLRASSRPELYESSLLATTLNSTAVREVVLGKRSFFTEPVEIGASTYEVGYQPVTNMDGSKLLAVIALATMDEQPRIEAEIARTTSFIYGTFAALGLVLLGIGALFAARVAKPILELIRATERVAQGKLKTSIPVKREDEIGDLMHAFNAMTHELEKSREIVAQTERELAWKEMARQVAHEIKNPLTPMKLSVQHMEHAFEAKDPNFNSIFRRVIRTLREQIDVLTRIATEFSHFGAMPRRKWGPVDIRRVADSAVALFDAERSRIRFIIDVPKDLPKVHSDEEELRRAFVNLIRNSIQAIEGWGVIVIRAYSAQGMVHISIRDTGFGMSDETMKKVFDPNFSTKTSGMGLGLAIVKRTITDMSGTIRVESLPGHGTTFFIDLPARTYTEEEA